MIKIKIGGVPEHFNLPWPMAIEEGLFQKQGIDLEWIEYPGGTGAMCADLRTGKLDIAVLLTEGIIADILNGNPSQIIQWYVTTPLKWGIHVPATSPFQNVESLKGKKYAISRFGSGSHLMAHVDASLRNWELNDDQFVVVGNLSGGLESLEKGNSDIFFWEKLMTKPYVDKGLLRRVGERPTPWPCFAIAARESFIEEQKVSIQKVLNIVSGFEKRMRMPDVRSLLMVEYGFLDDDIATWLQETKWSENALITKQELEPVIKSLLQLGIVKQEKDPSEIISPLTFYRNS